MEVQEVKEQLKAIFRQVINNDKWITIHPNGEDEKGRHLLLKDGESPKEAIERTYGNGEKSDSKGEKKRGDLGEDSPRHIYGKKTKTSIPVATKETNYPSWTKVEVLKEFDDEEKALDYAEERGEKVKSDYLNKTKESDKYGLVTWIEPEDLDFIKKHNYYPDKSDSNDKQSDRKEYKYEIPKDYKDSVKGYSKEKHEQAADFYGEKMAKAAKKANAGIGKDDNGQQYKTYSAQFEEYKALKDYHEEQAKSDSKGDKKERLRIVYKEDKDPDGSIVGIFEDEHGEYQALTPTVSKTFKTISGAERFLASRGFENPNKANNSKEQDMAIIDEIKKLITKVENEKGEDMDDKEKIENEKVDKRELIDEVGGILKGKVDDEIIRTIIGKLEKVAYDESERSADNKKVKNEDDEENEVKCGKKVKNEEKIEELEEEEKKDVENKCKNSKTDYFGKLNEIYNSASKAKETTEYVSIADRERAAEEYFAREVLK